MEECISAISTARGSSGVAIIRLSGENCFEIAQKMFKSKIDVCDFEPYKLYVGIIDGGDFSDFGMCVRFLAPKSYTGEDMVEFHCHGGIAITEGILKRTFELGSRPATNGEFSKRAFVNGKMSLSSAEGLIDMINAESKAEARCGFYLYRDKLLRKIEQLQDVLINILAQIDVDIDYPEEDVPACDENVISQRLNDLRSQIQTLINSFNGASKLKNGIKVVLVGRPNAGKSSILNSILKYDKAIVTSIAGTTRDVVDGTIEINGVKFNFFDTAGIRESDDTVEKIGIERSIKTLQTADLVVHIVDLESGYTVEDKEIDDKIDNLNKLTIINKGDLNIPTDLASDMIISAFNEENIDALKQMIYEKTVDESVVNSDDFITEARHHKALVDALNSICQAIDNVGNFSLDIITVDLRDAWQSLGLISGTTCEQAVVDEIFAKFCVGK